MFHAVWKELRPGMYSQSTEGEIRVISVNSTKVCDICCAINGFIALLKSIIFEHF